MRGEGRPSRLRRRPVLGAQVGDLLCGLRDIATGDAQQADVVQSPEQRHAREARDGRLEHDAEESVGQPARAHDRAVQPSCEAARKAARHAEAAREAARPAAPIVVVPIGAVPIGAVPIGGVPIGGALESVR